MSAQKRYDTDARSMALECGSAMHEVFAAVRIWQLEYTQDLPEHAAYQGERIFKKNRWRRIMKEAGTKKKGYDNEREHLLELCFAVLHSGSWEDEQRDRTRTMSNMELASIRYVDERLPYLDQWPLYVGDASDPESVVGIEQPFDVVLLYSDGKQIRFIGTIDGLVLQGAEHILDENKTASRVDSGWRNAFDMSHQVTGYCMACTSVFGVEVFKSRVTGLPIGGKDAPYVCEPLKRDHDNFINFASWVRHSTDVFESNRDNWESAPRYTHACNRYFRPCALLPFCCDTADGRKEQWTQMVEALPTPSERAVQELG